MGKYSLFGLSPISIKKKTVNLFDLLFLDKLLIFSYAHNIFIDFAVQLIFVFF